MRNLAMNEIHSVSGGQEVVWDSGWEYDVTDVVDDVSNMALLGIGVNVIAERAFNMAVVQQGAYLGATIGLAYGLFNYVGYNFLAKTL